MSRRMGSSTLKDWTRENFEPAVGYSPQNISLVKGWMVLIF
jgi:ABC-type protease/lipase transport system fused ATPase/permease subunit